MTAKRISKSKVRAEIWALLVLIFFLTWGLQLGVGTLADACGTQDASPPLGMLIPAFVSIIYRMYLDRAAKLYYRRSPRSPRILMIAYLLLTVVLVGVVLFESWRCQPALLSRWVGGVGPVLWTLLALQLYPRHKGDAFHAAGLGLGPSKQAVRIILGILFFLLLQPLLNWAFGLGAFQGVQAQIEGISLPSWLYPVGLIGFLLIAITGGPLGSLVFMFGEEYGWRGFLQDELESVGRLPAAVVIGFIWWAWHIPILLSDVHTYPPTLLGFTLALIFFVLWGIVQSYAVWKTGSVWTAAFSHGLVNGVYAFTLRYLVRPDDKLFSFGLGLYGLVLMFAIVLWLLRDPLWHAGRVNPELPSAEQHSQ